MKLLKTTALLCATALVSTPALAADTELSNVEVVVDLSAIDGSNALSYWPDLEKDLAAALTERAAVDPVSEAPRIRVEINKISVDGDTLLADSGEFNRMEGTVVIYESLNSDGSTVKTTGDERLNSFPVRLSAQTADTPIEEGWTMYVPPSKDKFYSVMVDTYADTVLERVEDKQN
ncbi:MULTISPECIES: hypothetical protein [unclassified Roseovarius]|uniref:hypothetical protein n=1 Tax=unclassified Roseovarius TaxID=2614913 RepID=UPI00273E2B25|nr:MULTISPECIES: hypothetical protein [unclassified Roseovarius]